jgi:hypothetical protein
MAPITMAPEAMKTANFCQKSKLFAKKARYNTTNTSQDTPATTVAEILNPRRVHACLFEQEP